MENVFTVLAGLCFAYAIIVRISIGLTQRVLTPWFILAAFFFLLSVFWQQMPGWAKGAVLFLLSAGAVIYCVIGARLIRTIRESRVDRPMKNLIVLGAQVQGRKPSGALKKRLDGALIRMQTHPDARVIVSGGKGRDEHFSEADIMEEYLQKNGGADYEILKEDRSRNTYENLKYSAQIIGDLSEETGVVSNCWHLYRAVELAKKLGYQKAFPVYASTGKITFFHYFTREIIAIFVQEVNRRLGRYENS